MDRYILIAIPLIAILLILLVGFPLYFNYRNSGNLQSSTPSTTIASSYQNPNNTIRQTSNDYNNSNLQQVTTSLSTSTTIATTAYTTIPSANSNFRIQPSFYSNSTLGDGFSSVVIPITIFDTKTNEPLTTPVQVQAQTSIGSITTKCNAPSICNITFYAPATLKTEDAVVSINAGGTIKTIPIEVMADLPTSMKIDATQLFIVSNYSGSLFAYNNDVYGAFTAHYGVNWASGLVKKNFSSIVVYVYDKNNNSALDGTVINFNADAGTFSNSSCITRRSYYYDTCNVIYKPLAETDNITIQVSLYNVSSSINISVISGYVCGRTSSSDCANA